MEITAANINQIINGKISFTELFAGYKGYVCLALVAVAAIFSIVLLILKKNNVKNFAFVLGVLLLCAGGVLLTNFQSADSFYGQTGGDNSGMSVMLSVRCDKIVGKEGDYIPADGCILPETSYSISEGETVYDVLVRAVRENEIHLECDTAGGDNSLAYVKGINYIYEFDYGELSGWVYRVNGVIPSVGCGAYKLRDGDTVEWLYSLELGNDMGTGVVNETS